MVIDPGDKSVGRHVFPIGIEISVQDFLMKKINPELLTGTEKIIPESGASYD